MASNSVNQSETYRPCVGVMLLNARGEVFVAERFDTPGAWQMPQGGIDPGEQAVDAARREMLEETGTDKAEILAEAADWLSYDLPEDIRKQAWGGQYRGQTQKWFAMRFTGSDQDIDLTREQPPEFKRWQWVPIDTVPERIVAFKRVVYERVVAEFRHLADRGL
ncbi:MAG: RNA pyrophosphohydrolase [Rhodospirillaceae bacterium]|jgi:putative (di)nucleoside polyphosphate hydrolase|nr:RNA pyrophosphohydrolase [Rhodospirillaceae bacterium]MBT6136372.1 RNA pyrophosphohydrolase [Rhodospirillaceae bacterium]MBT7755537.1 RNA pyrophosphohydrolase [Candidatus Magasanikbacteria bacterium]